MVGLGFSSTKLFASSVFVLVKNVREKAKGSVALDGSKKTGTHDQCASVENTVPKHVSAKSVLHNCDKKRTC